MFLFLSGFKTKLTSILIKINGIIEFDEIADFSIFNRQRKFINFNISGFSATNLSFPARFYSVQICK